MPVPEELYLEYRAAMSKADVDRLHVMIDDVSANDDTNSAYFTNLFRSGHALLTADPASAIEHANAAKALALESADQRGVIRAHMNLIRAYQELHDAPSTLQLAFETLHLNELVQEPFVHGSLMTTIGLVYRETGDYAPALEYLQRALDEFTRLEQKPFIANAICNIGGLYYYLDRHEDAARTLEHGIALQREVGNRDYEIGQTMALAKVYGNLGRADEGSKLLESMLHAAQDLGLTHHVAGATTDLARLHVQNGEHEQALAILDEYREILDQYPVSRMERDTIYSSALANLERFDESRSIILRALEHCRTLGLKGFVQNFHRLLRDIAKEEGDFAAYIEHNDAQQKLVEEMKGAEASRKIAMIESEKKISQMQQERERERAVLYSALPKHVADRVIRGEHVSDQFNSAAVAFADIVGFTKHSSEMPASATTQLLENIFITFDDVCRSHGVTKVKTIGDSYLCFKGDGTTEQNVDSIANVAREMLRSAHLWPNGLQIQFRIGAHVGPVTAGVIGTERLQYDIWGDTVNVASRMESSGEPGRIHVSEAFASFLGLRPRNDKFSAVDRERRDVIPSDSEEWRVAPRGEIEIKGKGTMQTFWLEFV